MLLIGGKPETKLEHYTFAPPPAPGSISHNLWDMLPGAGGHN